MVITLLANIYAQQANRMAIFWNILGGVCESVVRS